MLFARLTFSGCVPSSDGFCTLEFRNFPKLLYIMAYLVMKKSDINDKNKKKHKKQKGKGNRTLTYDLFHFERHLKV